MSGHVLVTGGAGFIGSNLADRLAREGHDVLVYDVLARPGVEANLTWLQRNHPHRIKAVVADIRDHAALRAAGSPPCRPPLGRAAGSGRLFAAR